ncbi:MAG: DUF4902 domain-containing protein [Methylococcales bacterium]|nr:DUF4902 domain-containing protein [Methylococcales bacterium]
MNLKSINGPAVITDPSSLKVASDGYIRLTFEEFRRIDLVHLISGLDEDGHEQVLDAAIQTNITGYTEWVSNTMPAISIGWDWTIKITQGFGGVYIRVAEPRGNVMLVDSHGQDFGPGKSATLIETVIDEIAWQNVVKSYINHRYSG